MQPTAERPIPAAMVFVSVVGGLILFGTSGPIRGLIALALTFAVLKTRRVQRVTAAPKLSL